MTPPIVRTAVSPVELARLFDDASEQAPVDARDLPVTVAADTELDINRPWQPGLLRTLHVRLPNELALDVQVPRGGDHWAHTFDEASVTLSSTGFGPEVSVTGDAGGLRSPSAFGSIESLRASVQLDIASPGAEFRCNRDPRALPVQLDAEVVHNGDYSHHLRIHVSRGGERLADVDIQHDEALGNSDVAHRAAVVTTQVPNAAGAARTVRAVYRTAEQPGGELQKLGPVPPTHLTLKNPNGTELEYPLQADIADNVGGITVRGLSLQDMRHVEGRLTAGGRVLMGMPREEVFVCASDTDCRHISPSGQWTQLAATHANGAVFVRAQRDTDAGGQPRLEVTVEEVDATQVQSKAPTDDAAKTRWQQTYTVSDRSDGAHVVQFRRQSPVAITQADWTPPVSGR